MLQAFAQHIKSIIVPEAGSSYLVAVSGGVDSMVLLDLLSESGYQVTAVHCNYGLRGAESDGDEAFVRSFCESSNIPVLVRDMKAQMGQGNTQQQARDLRYSWFDELISEGKGKAVLVAHHLNDSVETNIYNFIKGTSPTGLSPMRAVSGNVIRPLLPFSREQILGYAKECGLEWRDSSNTSTKYNRNKIRLHMLPTMQLINPEVVKTVYRNSEKQQAYAELARKLGLVIMEGDLEKGFQIPAEKLKDIALTPVLFELLSKDGLSWQQAEDAEKALGQTEGKTFELGRGGLFVEQGGIRYIVNSPKQDAVLFEDLSALATSDYFTVNNWAQGDAIPKSNSYASMDLNKVSWPLEWRLWEDGDVIKPFGMGGKKKLVSDVLIDSKVPLSAKKELMVLASAEEVLWIPEIKFSESVAIDTSTAQGSIISLRQ